MMWIDSIAQFGARFPHTVFGLLWTLVLTATLLAVDRRPWPARAYYGAYTFAQSFAVFMSAGWVMRLF